MFTELGIELIEQAKKSGMYKFYDTYMGNFGFTDIQVVEYKMCILQWLKSHKDYVLLYQDGYENGVCWWLTTEY